MPLRLAMWSGPRNISTAMLRAWGNRPDTIVCDEPLYAHYLKVTGLDHPGREEIIAHHENDWRAVVEWLTGPLPAGRSIFYQKHMAHHLLPEIDREWLLQVEHCFLIRDPREMLLSLSRKLPEPRLADTGLPQQVEIFNAVRQRTGRVPPVLDARDVLLDPERLLRLLCAALELPFTETMLSWPRGRRSTDGVWARYWYESVEASTRFEPYRPRTGELPDNLREMHGECLEYYRLLETHRLGTETA